MKSISGKRLCQLLEARGWVRRRVRGSHHNYAKSGSILRISVPVHGNAIDLGPARPGVVECFDAVGTRYGSSAWQATWWSPRARLPDGSLNSQKCKRPRLHKGQTATTNVVFDRRRDCRRRPVGDTNVGVSQSKLNTRRSGGRYSSGWTIVNAPRMSPAAKPRA